jgi:hypothetical protein
VWFVLPDVVLTLYKNINCDNEGEAKCLLSKLVIWTKCTHLFAFRRCSPFVDLLESSWMENGGGSSVSGCKQSGGGAYEREFCQFYCFGHEKDATNDEINSHRGYSNGPLLLQFN